MSYWKSKQQKSQKGTSLGDENLRQQSSLERIRLVISPFHTLVMLPKVSESLLKAFLEGYDCTRKLMDSLSTERTLVLTTQVYFPLKKKRTEF